MNINFIGPQLDLFFRDTALGVWRIVSLLLFIALIHVFGEGEVAVRIGFLVLAVTMLLQYIGAKLIIR